MTGDSGGLALHLEKILQPPTGRVFAALVEPEQMAVWWGPAGFTTLDLDLDVRAGGTYRITMQPPQGEAFHLRGEYRKVDPPRRLVYTFEWEEPDPDDRKTVVTLSFLEHGSGTKLVVDHGPFATEARRALHVAGWTESLERLEQALDDRSSAAGRPGS